MYPRSDSSQEQSDLDLHCLSNTLSETFLQTTISSLLAVIDALVVSNVSSA